MNGKILSRAAFEIAVRAAGENEQARADAMAHDASLRAEIGEWKALLKDATWYVDAWLNLHPIAEGKKLLDAISTKLAEPLS